MLKDVLVKHRREQVEGESFNSIASHGRRGLTGYSMCHRGVRITTGHHVDAHNQCHSASCRRPSWGGLASLAKTEGLTSMSPAAHPMPVEISAKLTPKISRVYLHLSTTVTSAETDWPCLTREMRMERPHRGLRLGFPPGPPGVSVSSDVGSCCQHRPRGNRIEGNSSPRTVRQVVGHCLQMRWEMAATASLSPLVWPQAPSAGFHQVKSPLYLTVKSCRLLIVSPGGLCR
jgi:hypothetical protein